MIKNPYPEPRYCSRCGSSIPVIKESQFCSIACKDRYYAAWANVIRQIHKWVMNPIYQARQLGLCELSRKYENRMMVKQVEVLF